MTEIRMADRLRCISLIIVCFPKLWTRTCHGAIRFELSHRPQHIDFNRNSFSVMKVKFAIRFSIVSVLDACCAGSDSSSVNCHSCAGKCGSFYQRVASLVS